MRGDGRNGSSPHGTASGGPREALGSIVAGAVLSLVGLFGVGLLVVTALAFVDGTATAPSVFACVFGAAVTLFSGYELHHLF